MWLRNTGLKSKVGFYVVAKHCFLKCGGVAGGCTKLFRETMVMLGVVAKHWFKVECAVCLLRGMRGSLF